MEKLFFRGTSPVPHMEDSSKTTQPVPQMEGSPKTTQPDVIGDCPLSYQKWKSGKVGKLGFSITIYKNV